MASIKGAYPGTSMELVQERKSRIPLISTAKNVPMTPIKRIKRIGRSEKEKIESDMYSNFFLNDQELFPNLLEFRE
jgi:hypothetical protein